MKFNSQICTTREQSERLLALGLNKETADIRGVEGIEHTPTYAWSLHRLIEMLGEVIQTNGKYLSLPDFGFYESQNLYDNVINCIEWLIKEGYFNKEYLV